MTRYDVGPVLNCSPQAYFAAAAKGVFPEGKKARLTDPYLLHNEFRIDVDASDLKDVRATCGCGLDRTRICPLCTQAVIAVAQCYNIKIRACTGKSLDRWTSTGGRGVHGVTKDYSLAGLPTEKRESLVEYLQSPAYVVPEALAALAHAESLCGHKIRPILDAKVTKDANHLLRAIKSTHDLTGRVCVLLKCLEDYTVDSSPLIQDIVQSHGENVQWRVSCRILYDSTHP
jgi:DNA primase catalytic subunit